MRVTRLPPILAISPPALAGEHRGCTKAPKPRGYRRGMKAKLGEQGYAAHKMLCSPTVMLRHIRRED